MNKSLIRAHPVSHSQPPTIIILVIDPVEADCMTYTSYLLSDPEHSYQICRATTLAAGMAQWRSQTPNLVLLEVNLPDGDGLVFLETLQLSRKDHLAKVPVIVLTRQGNERIAVQAMKLGAMDYLNKDDITSSSLQKSVWVAIEYQALARQLLRSQQQKEILSDVALRIRQSLELCQILQAAVDGLRQLLSCDRAIIYQFHPDWSGWVAVESVHTHELSIVSRGILDPCFAACHQEAYRQGRISYVNDTEASSLHPCYAKLLASIQVRANLVTPILQDEHLWGLLIAHECHQPRCWEASDIQWVQQLATQISIAIQQATAYAQLQVELRERQNAETHLQQLNQDLEHRVAQRTAACQQAEAENRSLRERLQFILASSPAVLYTCQTGGDFAPTFISDNISAHLGYTPNELIQQPDSWLSHLHPDDRPQVLHQLTRIIEQGHLSLEYRFQHKNGRYRWIQDEIRLVCSSHGEPCELVGYVVDISDRHQTQAQLRSLSDRLTLALQSANIGTWDWDLIQDALWDERMYTLYGLEELQHSVTYQDWVNAVHPDDRAHAEQTFEQALSTGKFDTEFRISLPNGTIRYIKAMGLMHYDHLGQPQRMVGLNYDITAHKQAEAALMRYTQEIEDLYENAPCGYHSLDPEGRYIRVNATELRWLGYAREEMIGKSVADFFTEESRQAFQRNYPIFLQQGWVKNLEYEMVCKDGSILPVLISATAVKDDNGTLLYNRATLLDIRDRKQVEQQLQQTNAELARATRLKDEFLANMSHELRTPLNAILGMSEALQDELLGELNNRQKKAITTIENGGRHLLELINDVLDLAKISSGKMELVLAPVSVRHLCDSSLLFIRQQALKKGIQVTSAIAPELGTITIDERRIRQVLINLLTNAVKFTAEGGRISLTVDQRTMLGEGRSQVTKQELATEQTDAWILFAVTDTGIGIRPEELSRLFQPFVQIDSNLNRQQSGTGLGLAMVKQIAGLHGGWVTVESHPGQGSCFTVILPYQQPSPQQSLPLLEVASPKAIVDRPERVTAPLILLAEDNEANVITITSYLSAHNYRIMAAHDGEEAIALAKAESPDVILMDIQMPGIDGLEAIQRIRADAQLATIPIIAVTALAMPEDQDRCLAAGANQYLSKPIQLKQLIEVIQRWLLETRD